MSNEIKARYSADISQLEIANDKLAAQNEKLTRQIAVLTAKASGFNKTHGSSWNAVKARVEEYTRAVKSATNLKDWVTAVEQLRGAQAEFEEINASVMAVTQSQKEATVVVTHMKDSYNDLESRLRNVREQMKQFATSSDDFRRLAAEEGKLKAGMEAFNNEVARVQLESKGNGSIRTLDQLAKRIANLRQQYKLMGDEDPARADAAKKIERMQAAYDRLSEALTNSNKTVTASGHSARVAADSLKGLDQQIDALTKRASSLSSTSTEFAKLTARIRSLTLARQKLQAEFKAVEVKPEKTLAAVPLGSLEAKMMQRDHLERMARGLSGQSFDTAAAKVRALNEEIARMEQLFKKAESTMVIDAVVINSVDGLTARIAHLQERMNKVGGASMMKWVEDPATGASVQRLVPGGATNEYRRMADELIGLKKALKELRSLQDIPVDKIVVARMSYDALREAIERTKKARDGAVVGSSEFESLSAKLAKLETAYKTMTAASNAASAATKKQKFEIRAAGDSMAGLAKQIEFLEAKQSKLAPGKEFDRLLSIISRLKARLKGMQEDAAKAGEALSKAATAPAGSFRRLDYELKKAKDDLKGMTAGTREFIAQSAKVDALQAEWAELDKVINRTTKTQKEGSGILGSIGGQAKSLVATYVGLHQVMTEITSEWEKQRAFQLDVANKAKEGEGALVNQAANIGVDNLGQVKAWARANQVDLFGKQADIVNLVGSAISGGASDVESAMKVTAAAMKLNVGNVELANEMLQGGITVGRLNNSDDFEAAFGQLRSSSKVSQAVNESEFIGNVMGKMAALTRGRMNMEGMSTERALEYITSASRIQVDRTGDTSSTNMQAIFQRMDEFVPVARKVLKDKSVATVDAATIKAFKDARTFDEKLDLLRANQAMGNQFIDKQRTGGPKELAFALVQNNQAVRQILKEAEEAVLPFKEAGVVFRDATMKIQAAVPNLIVAKQLEAGLEQARTDEKTKALGSARAVWDSIWNTSPDGTPAVNLSGFDRGKQFLAEAEFITSKVGGATERGLGRPYNDAELMMIQVRKLLNAEREAGNTVAYDALQKQLNSLEKIVAQLDELNQRVAGAPVRPAPRPAPIPPGPAPRPPIVP